MSAAVYLDYNATAPIRPEAAEAAACALAIGGNPSSVHAAGRLARAAVERGREQVAALVGARPQSVTFTSGGTEANALAINSAVAAGSKKPIVALIEHDSVMACAMATGLEVQGWPVGPDCVADLDWLRDRLKAWRAEDGPPFAALALANNETGVIQPIAEAAALLHEAGGWLHVDAVAGGRQDRRGFQRPGRRHPCRCRATSWAGRRARAPSWPGRARGCRSSSSAGARSAACAPAPRTCRASPASARRPRRRGATCRSRPARPPGGTRRRCA